MHGNSVALHGKNVTAMSTQKKKHRAYTVRSSMELYPSQRLSIRSIATW